MMKQTLIVFLFGLTFFTGKCQSFEEGWWQTFEGKIGTASVQLSLYNLGGEQLKGNYCYLKHETKLQLDGNNDNGKVKLIETMNGKVTGYFFGSIDKEDSFTGTWTDSAKTRNIPFRLHLEWASAAPTYSHRYTSLSETDTQVEAFMAKTKAAILKGDKQWLADNIHYPIMVSVNGKRTSIKTKEQFFNNFDGIVSQSYKNNVGAECTCNLFSNIQGVMLGNGEIWIDDFATAKGKVKLYIKTINN
jgi:hypothetical protein